MGAAPLPTCTNLSPVPGSPCPRPERPCPHQQGVHSWQNVEEPRSVSVSLRSKQLTSLETPSPLPPRVQDTPPAPGHSVAGWLTLSPESSLPFICLALAVLWPS